MFRAHSRLGAQPCAPTNDKQGKEPEETAFRTGARLCATQGFSPQQQMKIKGFQHIATVNIDDPDFTAIFLQPCGSGYVLALQTWCAYLVDVENATASRVIYPPWSWNVSSSHEDKPGLTVSFERPRGLYRCSFNPGMGEVEQQESIPGPEKLPAPQPPHLVTDEAVWFPSSGHGHTLIAARHDRLTGLSEDVSQIQGTDFFLLGPDNTVYLHRYDIGLILPHALDQPELVVNYRKIGCRDPRGVAFDADGNCWVMDEAGPAILRIDMKTRDVDRYDLSELHRKADDLDDPSPYPWHSCVWCKGYLVLGCCDAARVDIFRPVTEQN